MVSRWLLKIALVIGILGFAGVELGAPLITRVQLDGVAHDAANDAAHELLQTRDVNRALAVADQVTVQKDAALKPGSFFVDSAGLVHLTVEREAVSIVLKKWDRTKTWYDVEVEATSERRGS